MKSNWPAVSCALGRTQSSKQSKDSNTNQQASTYARRCAAKASGPVHSTFRTPASSDVTTNLAFDVASSIWASRIAKSTADCFFFRFLPVLTPFRRIVHSVSRSCFSTRYRHDRLGALPELRLKSGREAGRVGASQPLRGSLALVQEKAPLGGVGQAGRVCDLWPGQTTFNRPDA